MKNVSFAFVLAFLIFSATAFSQTVPPKDDFQFWNETTVSFPLVRAKDKKGKDFDRLTVYLYGVLRFSVDDSGASDKRIGAGFAYRFNRHVSFAPEFLYRSNHPYRTVNQSENRIRFALTLENRWQRVALFDRNLVEYRIRHSRKNSTRYRNRLRFEFPVKNEGKEIFAPFVSNEPFYDFLEKKLTRNELFVGINKKFSDKFSADFFYLFIKDRSFPKTINGIGVNLRFKSNRLLR